MPIKLSTAEQVFNNRLISPVDAKTIDIDRMLVNLFMLIKYNGQRPKAHRARKEVNIELLYDRLVSDAHAQQGLDAYPNIAKEWLRSDLVDMVYRGLSKEAVASLRPLHLDADRGQVLGGREVAPETGGVGSCCTSAAGPGASA